MSTSPALLFPPRPGLSALAAWVAADLRAAEGSLGWREPPPATAPPDPRQMPLPWEPRP